METRLLITTLIFYFSLYLFSHIQFNYHIWAEKLEGMVKIILTLQDRMIIKEPIISLKEKLGIAYKHKMKIKEENREKEQEDKWIFYKKYDEYAPSF